MTTICTLETAHETVKQLIKDFESNEHHYKLPSYSEAEVRQDFIDKFFTALGWDVTHQYQRNPQQQEVKVEKSQKQKDSANKKRADYAFYLAPDFRTVKFFVEAKKTSRLLRQNQADYFQTAKYGWNANTGISVLTDFQELVIIDCRFTPDIDTILSCECQYYSYQQLADIEVFKNVYWLLSREAVEAGNIATYVENLPLPKGKSRQLSLSGSGYQEIDDSFLNYIDNIRLQMAQAFYINNPTLTSYELTEATQRTIDRLVFMRFLEDKVIEPVNMLNAIANASNSWAKFIAESKRLDIKYNGVVFKPHFIDKPQFLGASESQFKKITSDFDHTNSPYDFNYIPIHILGNIYERFLGKVIEIQNNQAVIETKPEVRKAGGVYYTPKYIVDYIVKNTVGAKIDGKALSTITDIKISDISCGSGSFLIGAYDYLLKYYQNYYNEYPSVREKSDCIYDSENGVWVLSIAQKQQILLNHIYGVDIDPQAIEVTQLSLFLKLLEDETLVTANQMQVLFHEKILPDLTHNIRCGNALIDYSITENIELSTDEYRKIKPFDYAVNFPTVFDREKSGFDVLIGNPPYVKEYTNREVFEKVKQGNLAKYYQGKMDLWYFFVAYGLDLLNNKGKLGYIVPNNWVSNAGASILRNKVLEDGKIKQLIDFTSFMVFEDASIQTMIMILEKETKPKSYEFHHQSFKQGKLSHTIVQADLGEDKRVSTVLYPCVNRIDMKDQFLKFNSSDFNEVLDKILQAKNFDLTAKEVAQGIVMPQDFLNKKNQQILQWGSVGMGVFVLSNDEKENLKLSDNELNLIKPYFTSEQIHRYETQPLNSHWVIYTNSDFKKTDSMDKYPRLKAHLDSFEKIITSSNHPYGLHRSREESFFKGEKIIAQRKCVGKPVFSYTNFDTYVSATYYVIKTDRMNLKYLTGILNSKLIEFWLRHKGKMQGENFQVDKEPLLQVPIVKTDNKQLEADLIKNVEQLISAYPRLRQAKTDLDKELHQNRMNVIERNINNIVYQIYGLTKSEISVIES